MIPLDVRHQIQIPRERDVRVVTTLDQDLNCAESFRLVDLCANLLERKSVPFAVLWSAVKRAESAVSDADVRVVDVPVDDVRDDVARMQALAHAIRLSSELNQWSVRVEIEEVAHRSGRR